MKKEVYHSDFLFSTPTFLSGAGSVLNIAGNYFDYQYSPSSEEADARAIRSDWGVVGQDLNKATEEIVNNS